jgi:hypothetical protein
MRKNVLTRIRSGKSIKIVSAFIAINILSQCICPTVAMALTSGPGQEEFASFEPATTTDMVDLYSGDFNYNIPLLSVPGPNGGYPINLSYHSGVGMDQEASWVGLGWNLNVGSVNRQLRGLPDDYRSNPIEQKMNLKKSVTVAINIDTKAHKEKFGMTPPKEQSEQVASSSLSYQIYYNNYKGLGARIFANVTRETKNQVGSIGLGISYDSQEGLGLEPNMSLTAQKEGSQNSASIMAGLSYNSRAGIQEFSVSTSLSYVRGGSKLLKHQSPDNRHKTRDAAAAGFKSASTLSFSTNGTVPSVSIPMKTTSVPFDIKIGKLMTKWGTFEYKFPLYWTGSVTTSEVDNDGVFNVPGYGYLHTDEAEDGALKDFERSPISYSKNIKNLAPSSFTYDLFTQTGQGTGSMFRPYFSSVGILSSAKQESSEDQHRLNLEAGIGHAGSSFIAHFGFGYTNVSGSKTSGRWVAGNNMDPVLPFVSGNGEDTYEPYYFKQYGEKSAVLLANDELKQYWGGDEAVAVKVEKDKNNWVNDDFVATTQFVKNSTSTTSISAGGSQHFRKQRQARSSNIEVLTDDQALLYGHPESEFGYVVNTPTLKVPNKSFDHKERISEISILQPDGMRYTYGLPAYNVYQTEATFSVDANTASGPNTSTVPVPHDANGIKPFNTQTANTDEYLSKTTMREGYAHSWMLTSVVSTDYVDLTGDGPSRDDYGYWVKFNYKKTASNYKWRVPYTGANYFAGKRGDPSDDKGSFSYGEKEIYFLTSVETKTHYADFTLKQRFDGIQAKDELGTEADPDPTNNPMQCLDKITLYPRDIVTGRILNPLKTVFFEYDYLLCKYTKNSTSERDFDQEKLTLTKVYVNYGNSERGALSPYKFNYGNISDLQDNPNYNLQNMDRWGNYKNNSAYGNTANSYPFTDFPYTEQRADRKPTGAQWSLRQIELPTGGTINVTYESDDYGYVENRRATHMFDIIGINTPKDLTQAERTSSVLTDNTEKKNDGYFNVYFRLDENIGNLSDPEKTEYIRNHVKGLGGEMYFKIYAELVPQRINPFTGNVTPAKYDYVTGWANVASCVYVSDDVAYVKMLPENLKKYSIAGQQVSPFTKAAIQHLRLSRPELIYEASNEGGTAKAQILNLVTTAGKAFNDVMSMVRGFNTWAYAKNYGQKIQLNGRSVIRLADPNGQKYGGGLRVKELSINDSWDAGNQNISTSSSGTRSYGQKYNYTIEEDGQKISSGVAYEPNVGGDESALRRPIKYEEGLPLGTTSNLFLNSPLLEDYYPGASVGYRKVVVESIAPDQANLAGNIKIESSTAPLTIYEYYTPKDFPVIFDQTDLNADAAIVRPVMIPGVYASFKKRLARSQGYSILLNDMASKLRSVTKRTHPTLNNKEGSLISKEEYIYNTENPYSETAVNKLSDKVQVVNVDAGNGYNTIFQSAVMGESHDIFLDMHEDKQKSRGRGLDFNLDVKQISAVPYIIPAIVPIPYASDFEAALRTSVTMKVISRTGIIKKVITTTNESVISTENLAFDMETGKPLLTRTMNEFEDPVYKLAYPAHWYYPNMAGAYKNYGYELPNLSLSVSAGGQVSVSAGQIKNFTVGDELLVNNSFKAHIYELNTNSNYMKLIKRSGGYVSGGISSLKVINSGRRNLLEAEAGQVLVKELTDFSATQPYGIFSYGKVVDASAVEFKGKWDLICDKCGASVAGTAPQDPYITGESGIWRPFVSYVYKTDRAYTAGRSQEDGIYKDFDPFPWQHPTNKSLKWIAAQKITRYSLTGFELENQDALNNYSSALYGYGQSMVTAVSQGSEFKELGFDGFEDYSVSSCKDHQLDFEPNIDKITSAASHTGFYSIRLKPGEKVQVKTDMSNCHRP